MDIERMKTGDLPRREEMNDHEECTASFHGWLCTLTGGHRGAHMATTGVGEPLLAEWDELGGQWMDDDAEVQEEKR